MELVYHLFYGIGLGYFGLVSPGMLNMTALKIHLEFGKRASFKFSVGAALVVFVQAAIALFFVDFFVGNPEVINFLKTAAVFVLFFLAFFFFRLSRKKMKTKDGKKKRFFLRGIGMSSINMLGIPYYLGLGIFLTAEQKLILDLPYNLIFVIGAALGSFLLFSTYILFANKIVKKVNFVVRNINLILSLLFVVLGFLALNEIIT